VILPGFGTLAPSLRQLAPSRFVMLAAGVLGHVLAFGGKSDQLVRGVHRRSALLIGAHWHKTKTFEFPLGSHTGC
jgi:hypothetical protein